MVFQDPMSSLNPVLTICDQICETLRLHQGMSRADARVRAIELLDLVRIPMRAGGSTSIRIASRAACASG